MTTRVELTKVQVLGKNPTSFDDPITLSVVLEVFERVPTDPIDVKFTWAPIWDFSVDQELDELEVGPLTTLGKHEFTIQSDGPDFSQVPDPTGPTALLVSFTYKNQEFLHLGFNTTITCDGDIPDAFTSADQLTRFVGKCHPKHTVIQWDANASAENDTESINSACGEQRSKEIIQSPHESNKDSVGEPPLKKRREID
ncbi:histone chaperone ASF1 [Strigomonas culicis]|uniref:Histone chaperone ASF1 n=1 Tax=Strigomonas culicis TaxID=28005 RepID=S9UIQ9_9TRYP|nr:histone chaperone ASF1 [Strigomonas culicis]|eukprot:EPY30712.1 histone chaperone ASF1 [Strigomonas culicis]